MRVALTGGATGIGAEVAAKLAADGHEVTAFDVHEPAGVHRWIKTDLSDPASIAAALVQVEGPFDALINNAGLPPREGLEETILLVNFFGLRTFLDGMLPKLVEGASIVNVASRAGAKWRENLDEVKAFMQIDRADLPDFIAKREINPVRAYDLSKEAVIVLTIGQTEALLGRGFRINSVSPAAVSTGILDDFIAAFGERATKNIARVGRSGHPGEIADVIVFLTSPQSAWIKGQDIPVDGGTAAIGLADAMGLAD